MKPGKVTSNSLVILISEVLDRILRFALVILAARYLGDADYGKISFAIAFSSLFLILADFGIHQLLIREIARRPEEIERLMGNALFLKLCLSVVTAGLLYGAAQLTHKPADYLQVVYIIGAMQIIGSLAEYFSTAFQGLQQMKYAAIANIILSVSNTVLGAVVLVSGGDFVILAWTYLLSRVLKLLYCIVVSNARFARIAFRFEYPIIKFLIFQGASFGVLRFFSIMYTNVDSTMLALMIGDQAVGWYTVAYRLIFSMMVLPIGIMRAVYPAMSSYFTEKQTAFADLFGKSFKLLFWAGHAMAMIFFLFAEPIILTVFGEQYRHAADALKILVWSTSFYFIGTTMTHATRAAGMQNFTAKVVAASAVLNLVLNFMLIPKFSLVGAAFATLLAEFFTFSFHLWWVERKLSTPPFWRLLPKIILIDAITCSVLLLPADFNVLISIFAAVVINLAAVIGSGYYTKQELIQVFATLKRQRESQK